MSETLAGMSLVLASWVPCLLLFLGLGLLVCAAFRIEAGLAETGWLGLCALVLALQLWHVVLPVGWRAALAFSAIALVGWARWGRAAVRRWRSAPPSRAVPLLVLATVAALWLADRSLHQLDYGDSGVYHLTGVRWAAAFPTVPGLGNLHPYFGVSHGFFELAALLGAMSFTPGPEHVTNGLLAWGLIVAVLTAISTGPLPRRVAALILLPWAHWASMNRVMYSLSPDIAEVALGGFLVLWWWSACDEADPEQRERRLLVAMFVTTALVVMKLSAFGALPGAFVAGVLLTRRFRWSWRAAALCAAGLLPWSINVVIRNGVWPYPGAIIRFPVDWRVPQPAIEALNMYTRAYARGTLSHWDRPVGWSWVGPRLEAMVTWNDAFLLPLGLALACALVTVAVAPFAVAKAPAPLPALLLPIGALAAWFVNAPDERYAGIWLQAAPAFAAWVLLSRTDGGLLRRLAAALVAISALRLGNGLMTTGLNLSKSVFERPPVVKFEWVVSDAGAGLYRPESILCWDTPLPCSSVNEPKLTYRNPHDLAAGFKLSADLDSYVPAAVEQVYPEPSRR